MTRKNKPLNPDPSPTPNTNRRDYLRLLLALAGVGALSTSGTEVVKAAHNSDAPYPSGAWGYAGTAGHGTSERPSISELESAWNETYHVLHQDVDVGSRWYAEDGYSEWDLLPIVWDGLDTPADSDVPAGGVMIEQQESGNEFRLLGIDDDATHFREATVAWTETAFDQFTTLTFETAADHDAAIAEKGVHHQQPSNTDWAPATKVEKGYVPTDENGTNLDLYWPFDEDSGTTANDISGNNRDGTVNGASLQANGILGTDAYSFDGVDDDVSLSYDTPGSDYSVSVWVYPDSTGSGRGFIWNNFRDFSNGWGVLYDWSDNTIRIRDDTSNNDTDLLNTNAPADTWYHVAIAIEGTTPFTSYLWIDGVSQGTSDNASDNLSLMEKVYVGQRGTDAGYFTGLVDEVRQYDRLLTDSQVTQLYNTAI